MRIQRNSPAFDMGYSNVENQPVDDIFGLTRDSKPDIGAHEFFENVSPSFLSATSVSIYEGNSTIVTLEAYDQDGDDIIFSVFGGEDEAYFTVGSEDGKLCFNSKPDFEYPSDFNRDNEYEVLIKISDRYSNVYTELFVRVLDFDETAQTPEDSKILINGFSIGNGWREASWFGTYYSESHPWVYHSSMGWIYVVQSKEGSSWMWQTKLGWIWTDIDIFPYFYINSIGEWGFAGDQSKTGQYYLFETDNQRWTAFDSV